MRRSGCIDATLKVLINVVFLSQAHLLLHKFLRILLEKQFEPYKGENPLLIGLSNERPYLVLDPNLIWTCLSVICCNPAVHNCKPAVYTCKPAVYSCKVINFRFTVLFVLYSFWINTDLRINLNSIPYTDTCYFWLQPVMYHFTVDLFARGKAEPWKQRAIEFFWNSSWADKFA